MQKPGQAADQQHLGARQASQQWVDQLHEVVDLLPVGYLQLSFHMELVVQPGPARYCQ